MSRGCGLLDRVDVLIDGVGRALIPVLGDPLLGRDDLDVLVQLAREEPPALVDVAGEAHGLVLGQDEDLADVAVDAVRQREVDDPIDPAERDGRLGPIARERLQPGPPAPGQDDRQDVSQHAMPPLSFESSRLSLASHDRRRGVTARPLCTERRGKPTGWRAPSVPGWGPPRDDVDRAAAASGRGLSFRDHRSVRASETPRASPPWPRAPSEAPGSHLATAEERGPGRALSESTGSERRFMSGCYPKASMGDIIPERLRDHRPSNRHLVFSSHPTVATSKTVRSAGQYAMAHGALPVDKILFLTASPSLAPLYKVKEEHDTIKKRLQEADLGDHFLIQEEQHVSLDNLARHLSHYQPTIVHFSGHGTPLGEVILEDRRGNAEAVDPGRADPFF